MKKEAERLAGMEPTRPKKPRPQPCPLRQVGIGDGIGGGGRRFDGIASVSARLRSSPYFRMRDVVRELRPLFVQMTSETASAECHNNISFGRHFPGEFQNILPLNVESLMTTEPSSNPEQGFAVMHQYKKLDLVKTHGTYLVGGSTLGWNFITYPGKKSVYYGRTKKSLRAAQSKLPKK